MELGDERNDRYEIRHDDWNNAGKVVVLHRYLPRRTVVLSVGGKKTK